MTLWQNLAENAAIAIFAIYILVVLLLAVISNWHRQGKSFLSEYFLGGRTLGTWAFALTYAATSASGGSFIGFPSLVYTHGWSVAMWIGSYMIVPLVSMGLLAKRVNQVSRRTGAITIPDLLHERFRSPRLGLLATALIAFFLSFNLVAQFKAGSVILQTLLVGMPWFEQAKELTTTWVGEHPSWAAWSVTEVLLTNPGYAICLVVFAVAVVFYTTFGGFRAVVWTDVLQGFVMVGGVMLMLPIALWVSGGLANVTSELQAMTPPQDVLLRITRPANDELAEPRVLAPNTWLAIVGTSEGDRRVFRTISQVRWSPGEAEGEAYDAATGMWQAEVPAIELTYPPHISQAEVSKDDRQLAIAVAGAPETYAYGADQPGIYASLPGPSPTQVDGFLPLSLAISFFCMWTFSGAGQPSNMVRLMAFHGSRTLRHAIFTMSIYYSLIYFPLVVIFVSARVLLPGWETASDRIMPEMAAFLTDAIHAPWLTGILVAAPFAAVMSTMDSFLLMISSALVRDIYQRWLRPEAKEAEIRRLTYLATLGIGLGAMAAALNPPRFLQDIIVFTGAGLSSSFLVPVGLAMYWPRFNREGALASMLAGFLSLSALYIIGWLETGEVRAFEPGGFHPFLVSVSVSLLAGVLAAWMSSPPPADITHRFFGAEEGSPSSAAN